MPLIAFYSPISFLVLLGSLLISVLVYLKGIRAKIVPIANLCFLLTFIASIVTAINFLAGGLDDPATFAGKIAFMLLIPFYGAVVNVLARLWVRVAEFMGNKRLKIHIHAEIVEKK